MKLCRKKQQNTINKNTGNKNFLNIDICKKILYTCFTTKLFENQINYNTI